MRIGILGGTFDPIHYGHIRPAIEVKEALGLDKVLLMPNHIPPHKHQPNLSTAQRLKMVADVCAELAGFELCDIEANRDTPSYTVVTLEQLSTQYPNAELFFIMGMDSFIHLQSWHKWQQIFGFANLVLCQRPGWHLSNEHPMQQVLMARSAAIDTLKNPPQKHHPIHGRIFTVDITPQDISSTQIRSALAIGKIPTDALMPVTLNYIQKQQLYLS
ncbi:nicotinate-nucleotide adenylyltransferase [Shewanella putrefaciens]|uniref:Probable nicotinate-nucleotide adenylyltransferase n=3 Tax=Shewanella putrefaciens TaxID=24 RepID=NADD_SHEPC|nr:nicotinate-nucleotide adenylyltransferase [Shewanella putrefaciens]A4Y9F2.1 RecName: Full=Probable nicotinate-nucleotide adenylyltransferase; AltName: Full=Deamido-NAD(+) diphosphorylase; AltName: Full=Deamido-NAD(+) pyrophosphorylase; AltName: Full=Nicotinate mononucleotide adenylyltransferase; Short=NaMN adenylyltransferase [Shewanella putrefaciens CN-32]CAD6363861.1 putative nicotinate-nucleotide adenylyltransferase [Shewanella hafniensis]MCT8944888.1 nicotinate-nucleotide adenylyltransfer